MYFKVYFSTISRLKLMQLLLGICIINIIVLVYYYEGENIIKINKQYNHVKKYFYYCYLY